MLKTVIIDDELKARKALIAIIESNIDGVEIIGEAASVEDGMALISSRGDIDLILLDIRLKSQTSFELLSAIDYSKMAIIFITAYSEYAVKAIKYSALDYLLKPIDPADLKRAIDEAKKKLLIDPAERLALFEEFMNSKSQQPKKIVLSDAAGFRVVPLEEIIRCEGEKNYTTFHLSDGSKITTSKSLIEFDRLLSGEVFIRIYKSHLININYVKAYKKGKGGTAIMKDDSELPISREKKQLFLSKLNQGTL